MACRNLLDVCYDLLTWTGIAMTQAAAEESNGIARPRRVSKIMKEKVLNLRQMRLVFFLVALPIVCLGHPLTPCIFVYIYIYMYVIVLLWYVMVCNVNSGM